MHKRLGRIVAAFILALFVTPSVGGDYQAFVTSLNTNWVARNYFGIVQAIDYRLTIKTNDLAALIAKGDYYTSIDLNMVIVSNLVPVIEMVSTNLDWSADEDAEILLSEMVDSMKNRKQNEQAGYVYGLSSNQLDQLHQEFPTNHPGIKFFERFRILQYGTEQ